MRLFLVGLLLLTAACAARGHVQVATRIPADNRHVEILVASNRAGDGLGDREETLRARLHYDSYDVLAPPPDPHSHLRPIRVGRDPRRDFALARAPLAISGPQIQHYLSARLHRLPAPERNVLLYVHGYNNSFAEGLYRNAQIVADLDFRGVAMHFSWPSRGTIMGYAYDRESALYSRNDLRAALRNAAQAGPKSIIIMAHSMGSFLTMEALARMAEGPDRRLLDRIGVIYLSAADIDVDVFRRLAEALPVSIQRRMLVFVAGQDRVLRLSGMIRGDTGRVGSSTRPERDFKGLQINVIDVSGFTDSQLDHTIVPASPAVVRFQQRLINNPALARATLDAIPPGNAAPGPRRARLSTQHGGKGSPADRVDLISAVTKRPVAPPRPDTGNLPPKLGQTAAPF